MFFLIENVLTEIKKRPEHINYVEFIPLEDVESQYDSLHWHQNRCKAHIIQNQYVLNLNIEDPLKQKIRKWKGLAVLSNHSLILIGEENEEEKLMQFIKKTQFYHKTCGEVLYRLIDFLTESDIDEIDTFSHKLDLMEEQLLARKASKNFQDKLLQHRRRISIAKRYYNQLLEMIEFVYASPDSILTNEEKEEFHYLSHRISYSEEELLKSAEQIAQLYDHYQLIHNENQENAVRILSIVTSIFMPLTLLTGWYGMNFSKMPELTWEHGYEIIALVAISILVIELIWFKHKKWL